MDQSSQQTHHHHNHHHHNNLRGLSSQRPPSGSDIQHLIFNLARSGIRGQSHLLSSHNGHSYNLYLYPYQSEITWSKRFKAIKATHIYNSTSLKTIATRPSHKGIPCEQWTMALQKAIAEGHCSRLRYKGQQKRPPEKATATQKKLFWKGTTKA